MKKLLTAALFALAFSAQAQVELAGVKFEPTVNLGGANLQLNGAGIRYKAIFKVYAMGVYVGKKTKEPAEVSGQPGPKRITVTMLREIDANELGKLFSRGIEDEIPKNQFATVIPSIVRMSQVFSDHKTLKAGDSFTFDWIPGKGGILTIKGVAVADTFKEPEFYTAMMNIWLGKTPPDFKLKEALLGG